MEHKTYNIKHKTRSKKNASCFMLHASSRGFTLIEMLVALSVFSIVVTIGLTSLLNLSDVRRKVTTHEILLENFGFAMEKMAREIKEGSSYHCGTTFSTVPQSCPNGGPYFTFIDADGRPTMYRISGGVIQESFDGTNFYDLTLPDFVFDYYLTFYVRGAEKNDNLPPIVIITFGARGGAKPSAEAQINLQAAITQKSLDI